MISSVKDVWGRSGAKLRPHILPELILPYLLVVLLWDDDLGRGGGTGCRLRHPDQDHHSIVLPRVLALGEGREKGGRSSASLRRPSPLPAESKVFVYKLVWGGPGSARPNQFIPNTF